MADKAIDFSISRMDGKNAFLFPLILIQILSQMIAAEFQIIQEADRKFMLRDRQHILYVLAVIFYTYEYVSILYHEVWQTKRRSQSALTSS